MRTFIWLFIISVLLVVGVLVFKTKAPVVTTPVPQQPVTETQQSTTSTTQAPQPQKPAETTNKVTTKNGMKIEIVKEGTGEEIKAGQTAVVQYEGKLTDGKVFDATSLHDNQPFSFTVGGGQVIKGWDQGVLGMKVGETRLLTIPPELAYGPNGYPPIIPQNATLIFSVTLIGIK